MDNDVPRSGLNFWGIHICDLTVGGYPFLGQPFTNKASDSCLYPFAYWGHTLIKRSVYDKCIFRELNCIRVRDTITP
jgi:hypothetical protein